MELSLDPGVRYGDLNPGVAGRITPLPVTGDRLRDLLIDRDFNNAVVRCIRTAGR